MTKELVVRVTCDLCTKRTTEEESSTKQFVWDGDARELDVCMTCVDRLPSTTVGELMEVSRRQTTQTLPTSRTINRALGADPSRTPEECPVPECPFVGISLVAHWRAKHSDLEQTLDQYMGRPTPYECEECPKAFGRAQALAIHRMGHGRRAD